MRKEDKKKKGKEKRMRDKLTIPIAYIKMMMTTPAVTQLAAAIYHLFTLDSDTSSFYK
jgi:hypothetical protein